MNRILSSAAVVASLAAFAVNAHEKAMASVPAAKTEVKTLQQVELDPDFVRDREVITDLVVIPPNTALEKHWHPGEEFHYYLEGEVTIELDGLPSIVGKPGGVGHVPYRTHHRAIAGPAGAKILVVRVHSKGQPWRFAVD